MEIQSTGGGGRAQVNTSSESSNAKLEASTSSLESSMELQKLVLQLLESSGINIDTRA